MDMEDGEQGGEVQNGLYVGVAPSGKFCVRDLAQPYRPEAFQGQVFYRVVDHRRFSHHADAVAHLERVVADRRDAVRVAAAACMRRSA